MPEIDLSKKTELETALSDVRENLAADGYGIALAQVRLATGVLVLGFALWVGWNALKWDFISTLGPGPGFFPLIMAVMLTLLALVVIAEGARMTGTERRSAPPVSRDGWLRIGAVLVGSAGLFLLLEPLGFRITSLIFLIFVPAALGSRRWLILVLLAFAQSFGAYAIFRNGLDLPLPAGPFGL